MAINTDTSAQKTASLRFTSPEFTSSVMYISSVNPTLGFLTLTQYSTRQVMKGKGRHWQGSIGQDILNPNI